MLWPGDYLAKTHYGCAPDGVERTAHQTKKKDPTNMFFHHAPPYSKTIWKKDPLVLELGLFGGREC